MKSFPSSFIPALLFWLTLAVCTVVYWPGLSGSFLFDDYPNLEFLGRYNEITSHERLYLYLANGFAGPTGRPLSLLSFLINDNNWPSVAEPFKYTNLMLHLLNGCLLAWCTLWLLRLYTPNQSLERLAWIAVLSASCWLLHPFFVSTTLYVVQRMAQLATLFVLLGLLGYLYGRILLERFEIRGYVWMSLSLVIGTGLATLSKENGLLLPLLILVVEFTTLSRSPTPPLSRLWQMMLLWLPSVILLVYLVRQTFQATSSYQNRPFTLTERLLTEGRVLLDYLYYLIVPHTHTRGLFHDSYIVSTGWLTPPSTILAWLVIIALLSLALKLRWRYPLLSLALLFFFAGHVLESTVLPLELYFEHRNYLPAVFLFLPLARLVVEYYPQRPRSIIVGTSTLFLLLAWVTSQNASLWGQPTQLMLVWAESNRYSVRAQGFAAQELARQNRPDLAEQRLMQAIQDIPDSAALRIHLLMHKAMNTGVNSIEFRQHLESIQQLPYDAQVINLLGLFTGFFMKDKTHGLNPQDLLDLLQTISDHPNYRDKPLVMPLMAQLKGLIHTRQKQPDDALRYFSIALEQYKNVETGLSQTAVLASHGLHAAALKKLNHAQDILTRQPSSTLKRSRAEYEREIARIRQLLQEDFEKFLFINEKLN